MKVIQLVYLLVYRVFKYQFPYKEIGNTPLLPNNQFNFLKNKSSLDESLTLTFLNISDKFTDWDDESKEKLWLYNLHYFDFINGNTDQKISVRLIDNWIENNPSFQGLGWEPYPTSLRVVNWIKFLIDKKVLNKTFIENLKLQSGHLYKNLEYHIQANHLFKNFKACFFTGLFFQDKEILNFSEKKLIGELKEQILEDGSHYENSPMYHCIMLEDLLDIISISKSYNYILPAVFVRKAEKMLSYCYKICYPDNSFPNFNDSIQGISFTIKELAIFAKDLGLKIKKEKPMSVYKTKSIIRSKKEETILMLKIGGMSPDYQPGHSHADFSTFEFMIKDCKIVSDTGVSSYQSKAIRQFERSSKAHNVLTVNGKSQADLWGEFRVGKRPSKMQIRICQENPNLEIICTHNGYKETTYRKLTHCKNGFSIEDRFFGKTEEKIESRLHLNAGVEIAPINSNSLGLHFRGELIALLVHNDSEVKIDKYNMAVEFGKRLPANVIIFTNKAPKAINYKVKAVLNQNN